ncbi:hypothetical protein LTR95_003680 [Oleoguttula sp. CCFEE 5521]
MRATTWRGRGRGRGNWSTPHNPRAQIRLPPPPPLGGLHEILKPDDFEELEMAEAISHESAVISDFQVLASYNWAGSTGPHLIVPGLPPLWKPLKVATQLPQDAGEYLRDQNAARYPKHPLEPAASVVLAQDAEFDTQRADIFACTSTLGNLLRFLKGDEKSFRFTVEAVGKTVFFTRRENAPDEKILGPKGYGPTGHGHTFPEHYTQWEFSCKGSTSHQRIVSYDFNGLHLALRFEADGYLEDKEPRIDEASHAGSQGSIPEIEGLKVQRGGHLVSQSSIFELKTRSIYKKDEDHLSDNLPRLWLAQIPHLTLAFHEYGMFKPENISVREVHSELQQWQTDNADLLCRYGRLLKKLIALARDPNFGKYEVCYSTPGQLEVRHQGGTVFSPLSSKATEDWLSRDDVASDSDSSGIILGADENDSDGAALSDEDDDGFVLDYTVCSDACDYCGRCRYKSR